MDTSNMNNMVILIVAILAALGVALLMWNSIQRRRRKALRTRFGHEYDHAVEIYGGPRPAEQELAAREKRVKTFNIRPLTPEQHQRFSTSWKEVQARFVDNPTMAVTQADSLVKEVMVARGYPMGDFEQRSADISVDHPNVVEHYRAAQDIAESNRHGQASTEDLRQAFMHYRVLFEDLLEVAPPLRRASAR